MPSMALVSTGSPHASWFFLPNPLLISSIWTGTIAMACSWSVVELAAGVISACLPTLRPLIKKVSKTVSDAIGSGGRTGHGRTRHNTATGSISDQKLVTTNSPHRLRTSHSSEARFIHMGMTPGAYEPPAMDRGDLPLVPIKPCNAKARALERLSASASLKSIAIQVDTEITVSIEHVTSNREEMCPWETVVVSSGRAAEAV